VPRNLVGQPCFADAWLARDQEQAAAPGDGVIETR
jgi:hypothetical protein